MNLTTIDLAVQALEIEKAKIDSAIAELKANLKGQSVPKPVGGRKASVAAAPEKVTTKRKGRRRMSPAARKALSESAKRRWAKAKKAGKSTL